MRVSRHYSDHHIKEDNLETRVAVYEDQIRGWFHDPARILQKASDHAGFVLLLIAVNYVESYAIFRRGEDSNRQSRDFFLDAFKEIFFSEAEDSRILDDAIDEFYDQVRCGLFHAGITRGKVVLTELPRAVDIEVNNQTGKVVRIKIDPHKLLDEVEDHFSSYVMRLRDPNEAELRKNFDKAWNLTRVKDCCKEGAAKRRVRL